MYCCYFHCRLAIAVPLVLQLLTILVFVNCAKMHLPFAMKFNDASSDADTGGCNPTKLAF